MIIKNVLFISEKFIGGGLETRIISQVRFYRKTGIKCFLACEQFNKEYFDAFDGVYSDIKMIPYENKLDMTRISEIVSKLNTICLKNNIDFIDCHPFYSSVYGSLLSKSLNIPTVYTLHGQRSLDFYENDFLCKEQKTFIKDTITKGFDQYFIVGKHLLEQNREYITKWSIAKNCIEIDNKEKIFNKSYKWVIVSRLDLIKSNIIIDDLEILKHTNIKSVDIIGSGDGTSLINKYISNNKEIEVNMIGWIDDVRNYLYESNYDGLIGMGQCVLEALSLNIPAVLQGYNGLYGPIDKSNYEYISDNNFVSYEKKDKRAVISAINGIYSNTNNYFLKKYVNRKNGSRNLWRKYLIKCKIVKLRKVLYRCINNKNHSS